MRSRQGSRLTVFAALAALSIAGCEKASDAAAELDPADFPESIDDDPILELESTGKGEKRALRLAPKKGLEQKLRFVMKGGAGGMNMDMTMVMDSEVTRVGSDGTFDVTVGLSDVSTKDMPGGAATHEMLQEKMGMAEIEKLESSGKGTLVIDTTKALPQRMKLDMKIAVTTKVNGKTQSQDSDFQFDWTSM